MDEVVVEDAPAVVAAEQPEQPAVVADEPAAEAEPDVVEKEAPAAEEPASEEAEEVPDFSVVPDEEVRRFFVHMYIFCSRVYFSFIYVYFLFFSTIVNPFG